MAKEKSEPPLKTNGDALSGAVEAAATPAQPDQSAHPQLNVLGQYIKDLSFESPRAPETLQSPGDNPQLQVSVNVNAAAREEEIYEVALNFEVRASSNTGVIYNLELVYGSLFRLRNIPPPMLEPVLFVDCPTIIFPFVRRLLSDVTRDGGFPPVLLDPIDFGKLYAENRARGAARAETLAKN